MNKDKRGQFFLLAAVIISVVVISLGAITNRAIVHDSILDIEGLSQEIQKETGEVLNYEIYTSTSSSGKIEDFAILMANEIRDKYPETEFIFVFGSVKEYALLNHCRKRKSTGFPTYEWDMKYDYVS
jgi:hypothetical protein